MRVQGGCRCQGDIQPYILDARVVVALGRHRSSSPAPFLPQVWRWPYQCQNSGPSNQGYSFPAWVPAQWVPQHKVTAHTATSPCVPQILPGLYLGNFVGKWNQLLQRCSPAGYWGLLELVSPCLQMLPDILPAPTTLSAPTALPAPAPLCHPVWVGSSGSKDTVAKARQRPLALHGFHI